MWRDAHASVPVDTEVFDSLPRQAISPKVVPDEEFVGLGQGAEMNETKPDAASENDHCDRNESEGRTAGRKNDRDK